jgi:hypothetical protein
VVEIAAAKSDSSSLELFSVGSFPPPPLAQAAGLHEMQPGNCVRVGKRLAELLITQASVFPKG